MAKLKNLKYATNPTELKVIISKEMNTVLNKVADEMLDELAKQIDKDIYTHDYFPNLLYYGGTNDDGNYGFNEPTFEFREAWKKNIVKNDGVNSSSIAISYDPSKMTKKVHKSKTGNINLKLFPGLFSEKNLSSHGGFTSGLMVGSINEDMKINTLRNMSKLRKPFWENFKRRMKAGFIRRTILKKAKEVGLNVS